MITNEKQYKMARIKVARLRRFISGLMVDVDTHAEQSVETRDDMIALANEIKTLDRELAWYDVLRSSEMKIIDIKSFDQLANGLIQARILRGLSQRALGERLGLRPEQIQRYEASQYDGASYSRLRQVAEALHVRIESVMHLRQDSV